MPLNILGTSIILSSILIPSTSSLSNPTSSQLGPSNPASRSDSPLLADLIIGQVSDIGDGDTRFIWVKHTGFLFGTTTASAAADTLKIAIDGSETSGVSGDAVIIAELANGEAIAIPRPGIAGGYILVTGNSSNHVGAETLIIAT